MSETTQRRIYRVLLVVLFSMLGEYSLRGFGHFLEIPALAILVIFNYVPYFLILEDFIGRYKLRPLQLYLIAITFGVYWQIIGTPAAILPNPALLPEFVLGFNVYGIFYNDFIVWPLLQTVFAFYLANRILPRQEHKPLLPTWGIVAAVFAFSVVTFSFRVFVPSMPLPTVYQFTVLTVMMFAALALFMWLTRKNNLPDQKLPEFKKDTVLDVLGVVVVFIMLYLIFLVPYASKVEGVTPLNTNAVPLFLLYTFVTALVFVVRRLSAKDSLLI